VLEPPQPVESRNRLTVIRNQAAPSAGRPPAKFEGPAESGVPKPTQEKVMKNVLRRIVTVATLFAIAVAAVPSLAAGTPSGVVNVNSASAAELERLPGVGPALAGRILEYRQKNGSFQKVEDLMLVRGIGEKSFERLKPYVAVSGETTLTDAVRLPRAKRATTEPKG